MGTNNMIDWNGKLEVVSGDNVFPASLQETIEGPAEWCRRVAYDKYIEQWFSEDGRHCLNTKITIRNKPAAAVAPGDIVWGDPIEVGGVRPDWLRNDGQRVKWSHRYANGTSFAGELQWGGVGIQPVESIRLPANHPHYRTEKPTTGPSEVLTGTERLERLEALTARLAAIEVRSYQCDAVQQAIYDARQLALPIDPDLIKAREICAVIADGMDDGGLAIEYRRGDLDEQFEVLAALAGLRSPASDHRSKTA